MPWLYKARLADVLLQSKELKAEARNLRMKLQYLRRIYPLRGGPTSADDEKPIPPPADGPPKP